MGLQNPKRGLLTRNYGLRKKWLLSLVGHPPLPPASSLLLVPCVGQTHAEAKGERVWVRLRQACALGASARGWV